MTALAQRPTSSPTQQRPAGLPIPKDIDARLKSGRKAMKKESNLRRLCHKFWVGEHYWYQKVGGALGVLSTALIDVTGGKPGHRVRNTYNFVASVVEGKVSASTGTIPGYEINPSSPDLEDVAGARIAQQVAIYGYDKWFLRRVRQKVYTLAFVQREGFAFPYYDGNIGPFVPGPDGQIRGLGDVRVETFSRSEVMWEPGMDFMESRWHAIERAVPVSRIKAMAGYIGGDLQKDATTADLPTEKKSEDMALFTDYLERPSPQYPHGRRCFIANKRVVVDFRMDPSAPEDADWWEPYPYMDAHGVVCDEPCIHRLSYTVNPDGDDLGLTERIIDLSRTIDDCWNKLLEWKNRCLMPRKQASRSMNATRSNDVPGGLDLYDIDPLNPNAKPEWENAVRVPQEIFQILNLALEHLRALSADIDVQPDANVAARTANTAVGQAQSRWASFLGDAEEFDSRLMRHCLTIVARYYVEQRIIDIRGRYGWEPPTAFTGADMRSQVNVRVLPGSIQSQSRAQIMADVQFMQTNFPGALSPEAVWAALHGGSADALLRTYQLDQAMANSVVQRLKGGPDAAREFGMRQDMDFGDPALGFMVPAFMPRKVDNVAIWKQVFGDAMKEDWYQRQSPEVKHLYDMVFDALDHQEQQRKLMMLQQEQGVAAQLGQANAAAPQAPIPGPQPAGPLSPAQAAPAALTPPQ